MRFERSILAVSRQLSFPWYSEPLATWQATTLRGDVPVNLEILVGREEVELALRAHSGSVCALRIRVGHPARCTLDGQQRCWDAEGVSSEEPDPDELVSWCRPFLGNRSAISDVDAGDWERRVRAACSATTAHAVALADPSALGLASTTPPSARLFIYSALLEDSSRRVEDVLRVSPAVLVVAASCGRGDIVTRIKRGERLRNLVAASIEMLGTKHRNAAALLRAAPPTVSASTLWSALLVPEADVNDLPAGEARSHWYVALSEWSRIASTHDLGKDATRRLGGFLSRHGGELARHTGDAASTVREILDWLQATRSRVPTRRTALDTVLTHVARWHEALWDHSTARLPENTAFPPGPTAVRPTEGVDVEQITTVGELDAEGRRMQHCVAAMAPLALDERFAFFRGTCAGQRVTICVERASRWRLVEAAGVANAPVTRRDLIMRWVLRLAP